MLCRYIWILFGFCSSRLVVLDYMSFNQKWNLLMRPMKHEQLDFIEFFFQWIFNTNWQIAFSNYKPCVIKIVGQFFRVFDQINQKSHIICFFVCYLFKSNIHWICTRTHKHKHTQLLNSIENQNKRLVVDSCGWIGCNGINFPFCKLKTHSIAHT